MTFLKRLIFISAVLALSSCSSDTTKPSELLQDNALSETESQPYRSCENVKIIQSDNGFIFYNKSGSKIIEHESKSISVRISEGTSKGLNPDRKECNFPFIVTNSGKYGLVLPDGPIFAERLFENIGDLHENVLAFSENKKWGLINRSGKIIVKPIFTSIRWYGDGKFIVDEREETAFLMDKEGRRSNLADDPNYSMKYRQHLPPREAYLVCSDDSRLDIRNGKWGIVSQQNENVIAFKYRALSCFQDGQAMAAIDELKHWCPVGKTGQLRDKTKCSDFYYEVNWSHHFPERLSEDPYESSVLWNKAYLEYGKGLIPEPPRYIPDGIMGRSILLATPLDHQY